MLFWMLAAVLTLGACLAVLVPMMRRGPERQADAAHDVEVYRDQLAEIDRDVARGVLSTNDAETARAEIARRILKADRAAATDGAQSGTGSATMRVAATAAILAVPLLSWGLYGMTGSPDLPDQPLQARLERNPADSSMAELVARAERHLAANPEDGRGWEVLAPIYLRMSRHADAANAFRNAIRLSGPSAQREIGLGEALAALAGGMITADAQAAFERALELEPGHPRARYLIAVGHAQEGDTETAAEIWRAMLTDLPADSPWRGAVTTALRQLGHDEQPPVPGPTSEDVAAAAALTDDERGQMIASMVAGLDERLRENPGDGAGWQRLVQSYVVLGRTDDARDALRRGMAALGAQSEDGVRLAALAGSLGLRGGDQK